MFPLTLTAQGRAHQTGRTPPALSQDADPDPGADIHASGSSICMSTSFSRVRLCVRRKSRHANSDLSVIVLCHLLAADEPSRIVHCPGKSLFALQFDQKVPGFLTRAACCARDGMFRASIDNDDVENDHSTCRICRVSNRHSSWTIRMTKIPCQRHRGYHLYFT